MYRVDFYNELGEIVATTMHNSIDNFLNYDNALNSFIYGLKSDLYHRVNLIALDSNNSQYSETICSKSFFGDL